MLLAKGTQALSFAIELLHRQRGDVGLGALVPVQEALEIDGVADLQVADGLVDFGLLGLKDMITFFRSRSPS